MKKTTFVRPHRRKGTKGVSGHSRQTVFFMGKDRETFWDKKGEYVKIDGLKIYRYIRGLGYVGLG